MFPQYVLKTLKIGGSREGSTWKHMEELIRLIQQHNVSPRLPLVERTPGKLAFSVDTLGDEMFIRDLKRVLVMKQFLLFIKPAQSPWVPQEEINPQVGQGRRQKQHHSQVLAACEHF